MQHLSEKIAEPPRCEECQEIASKWEYIPEYEAGSWRVGAYCDRHFAKTNYTIEVWKGTIPVPEDWSDEYLKEFVAQWNKEIEEEYGLS
jgi:hypothetical protein